MVMTMEWCEIAKSYFENEKVRYGPGPLDGVVVLDASIANPAAYFASSILAEMGAEVIKIEPPGGDPLREVTPYGEIYIAGSGLPWVVEGRNKEFITLNLEKEEGREIFRHLACKADVVIESFPPGESDRMGIGYRQLRELNPGLIYLAFSAYGHFGPNARKFSKVPDSNLLGLANSSYMDAAKELPEAGEPYNQPTAPGFWMALYLAGLYGVSGVLLALFYRLKSGEGQMIDITTTDAMVHLIEGLYWAFAFKEPMPVGILPLDYGTSIYAFWKAKDGYVFAAGATDSNFAALVTQLGREELFEKYPTLPERLKLDNQRVIYNELAKEFRKYTFQELVEKMLKWREEGRDGVAVYMKVMTPIEILKEKYWYERKDFTDIPYKGKKLKVVNPVWKLSSSPLKLKWLAKGVGEDNSFVYKKYLGFGRREPENLKENGII